MVRVSPSSTPIGGYCAPEFASVRGQFERNFAERGEVGAAVAAWVDGQLVVNLWGGWRDGARQKHWHEDTLASVFSGSKGLTSTCLHLLAERGESIPAGTLILSGGITEAVAVQAGDNVTLRVQGMGSTSIRFV